ncbi:MAG TPA: tetratricopeptide repeat protein [Pyrinomonadaceae bacterium]|jgi:tetratricopeptide (TPR) repeat protein|nr:tetratricopeptide repeat protein [Pyrinomonadaceae bacterium]
MLRPARKFVTAAALVAACAASAVRAQERVTTAPPKPTKIITVQGQVSLPEGAPAADSVVVTLTTRGGAVRQAYTNDLGRFEFEGMEEGTYTLSAKSLNDPALRSESVLTDASRTATGNLNVSLTLRREARADDKVRPAEVLTAAEAEQRVPKDALKAFRRGAKFRKSNETDKALQSYTRAVELYPEYFQALAERGDLLVTRRKLAEAAADFERALKLNPQYAPALRGSGYCKLEKREFAEAAKDFEKAVSAQPDNANTYLLLGIAYLELDRRAAAKEALFKALGSGSRQELRAYIYLANLYARGRQYKEAAEELHKYLEAVPTDPEAAKLRAIEARWLALAASP